MNVNIICVGKLKEEAVRAAVGEYEKRLSRFCKINAEVLQDKPIPEKASKAEYENILRLEGEQILKKIGKNDTVVAMCIEGKQLSSEELAEKMNGFFLESQTVDFIIGGSLGLSEEVKKRADFKLSMSKMTFPHNLARLILTEQIYRAFKINANESYHK